MAAAKVLDNLVIVLSGKLSSTQTAISNLIKRNGGEVKPSITKRVQ